MRTTDGGQWPPWADAMREQIDNLEAELKATDEIANRQADYIDKLQEQIEDLTRRLEIIEADANERAD